MLFPTTSIISYIQQQRFQQLYYHHFLKTGNAEGVCRIDKDVRTRLLNLTLLINH
jgi:hypothetical protein